MIDTQTPTFRRLWLQLRIAGKTAENTEEFGEGRCLDRDRLGTANLGPFAQSIKGFQTVGVGIVKAVIAVVTTADTEG